MQKVIFENYKSFKNKEEMELKPITVVIGKNSAGKSSIAKLFPLIETSLRGEFSEPFLLNNDGVEIGAEFKDLVFNQKTTGANALSIDLYEGKDSLKIKVIQSDPLIDSYEILEWKLNANGNLTEKDDNSNYRGFLLQDGDNLKPCNLLFRTDYIGPFRKLPERSYNRHATSHGSSKFGVYGENAYSYLINDSLVESTLVSKVSDWYKENFSGWEISVNSDKAPFYQIQLSRENSKTGINLKDVGQGMSQALPLIIRAMMAATEETLIILEQPELHLHPAAHGSLAELFVQSTVSDPNKKYLIETHSQNFLLRLRYLVADGVLDKNNLKIYFVDFDEEKGISHLQAIDVDENGDVSFWPEGIFNESFEEARAIIRAQKRRKP